MYLIINKLINGGGKRIKRFFYQNYAKAYFKSRGANLHSSSFFYGRTLLSFPKSSHVEIGKHFICRSGKSEAIDNSSTSKIVVGPNASLIIGDFSGISNTVIYAMQKVVIGHYVNIGAGTLIFDTNFHSTSWADRLSRETDCINARTAPVIIGDCVFIGARCIITKGVTIGDKSMVAAGSVVIRDIPSGELWGGNPAKFIKKVT